MSRHWNWLAMCMLAMIGLVDPAAAEIVGNPLLPRPITDTASGSIFLLNDPFTQPGVLNDFGIYDARPTQTALNITPVIYRPVVGGWEITGIGRTRNSTGLGAQNHAFDLVAGSDLVGPGYFFGWKDGGQGTNNAGVIEWSNGGPGSVNWLGAGHTNFNPGEVRANAATLNRTYSIQADVVDAGMAPLQTIGNPVIDAPTIDGAVGSLFVMSGNPFNQTGRVQDWRFFNGVSNDFTPLILEKVGADYLIRGIGQTVSSSGQGEQHFAFNLVSGSAYVGPNYFFGWKDGGQNVNNTGVAEWDDMTADQVIWFNSGHTTFSTGENLGAGLLTLSRTYSIEANSIPEPGTLAGLALMGAAAFGRRRR